MFQLTVSCHYFPKRHISFIYLAVLKYKFYMIIGSNLEGYNVESQKGIITIPRCFIENQKSDIPLYKVYGDSALLVFNGTSLNSVNALLVLSQSIEHYIVACSKCIHINSWAHSS